jgi:hypothetical protein
LSGAFNNLQDCATCTPADQEAIVHKLKVRAQQQRISSSMLRVATDRACCWLADLHSQSLKLNVS